LTWCFAGVFEVEFSTSTFIGFLRKARVRAGLKVEQWIVGFEEFLDFKVSLGRESVVGHPYLSDSGAEHVLARLADGRGDEHELYGGLAVAGDDDLFPALGCGDEFGEVCFGVMDVYFHADRLANMVS
jgi:hypothetical protein